MVLQTLGHKERNNMKIKIAEKDLKKVGYTATADQIVNSRGDVVGQMDPYGDFQTTDEFLLGLLNKPAAPKRARNAKGHLIADDPSTPDINEAWEQ